VHSATDALERAESFAADVVLLDIGLPDMDGYEVARNLRGRPALAGLQIIALTGYGQQDDMRRAEAAGFDNYLVKPVDFVALNRALAKRQQ
jgi:CheY-like chemotaxis protein